MDLKNRNGLWLRYRLRRSSRLENKHRKSRMLPSIARGPRQEPASNTHPPLGARGFPRTHTENTEDTENTESAQDWHRHESPGLFELMRRIRKNGDRIFEFRSPTRCQLLHKVFSFYNRDLRRNPCVDSSFFYIMAGA